jgi:phenylacetic acid degradation operon negative regulatory protein
MQTPLTDNHISSRSLVLALVDTEGALRARDAFDVGEALGFTPNQIRLTLSRLVDDGLLTSTGRGRQAVLLTTDRHERLHGPEPEWLASAFRQDAGHAPWDGIWRTASFTLGEDRKRERNALREVLVGMGAAALMPGFYVHAVDWNPWLEPAIDHLAVADAVVVSEIERWTVHGLTEPRAIAAHLWPLDRIAESYRAFIERFSSVPSPSGDPTAILARAVDSASAFEFCIRQDPLLPPELLPDDWPGRGARSILIDAANLVHTGRTGLGTPRLFTRFDRVIASHRSASATIT